MATDNTLAEAIRLFSEFFDATDLSIAILDDSARYVFYNAACAQLDGCSTEKALGKQMHEVNPNFDTVNSTMLDALYHQKRFIDKYQLYINASGKPVHYVFTTLPLIDAQGKAAGVIEFGRDLSLVHSQHTQVLDLLDRLSGGKGDRQVNIVTEDSGMLRLLRRAERLAQINIPVLIYGETGTGKELFAKRLHYQSPRAEHPFMVLNCAAIPDNLLESTLFGTVRGAFTGAEDRGGMMEAVNGGTLLLDELNSMPLPLQGKLLRVLQEHTFCRVGSSREIHADVRFVAATNEEPQQMLRRQSIRPDLLYRLNVGFLAIPPLKQRGRDIRLLAQFFITKYADITAGRVKGISEAVLQRLERHTWPGNVRMLENVILQSLILSENGEELDFILLDEGQNQPESQRPRPFDSTHKAIPQNTGALREVDEDHPILLESEIAAFERNLILHCLQRHPNLTDAARYCGIPRTTLQYKMKKHDLHLTRSVSD